MVKSQKCEIDFTECVGGVSSFERWDEKTAAAAILCFVIFPHVEHLITSMNSATTCGRGEAG